jgi:hypothetical protein
MHQLNSACGISRIRRAIVLVMVLASFWLTPARACAQDGWSFEGQGILFYTDDVGLFSATRRLSRDGDQI